MSKQKTGRCAGAHSVLAGGYEIAALAAGGSIAIVDAVLDGSIANGYALVR